MAEEIVPVFAPPYKEAVAQDVGPRREQTLEALGKLRPFFDRRYGTVTVGNSCPVTDGAAAMLVASADKARELGLKPAGRLKGYAYAGLDPARMGLGPTYATPIALERAGVKFTDIGLVELNEAFAAQSVACVRMLGLDAERTNVYGGGIALGHPLGATGAKLLTTLVHALRRRGGRYGLATMCIGVGQGIALVVEREG